LGFDALANAGDAARVARFALQALQRLGSFLKFLSAKNSCSPAVQTNSAAQSTQLRILSWNSIVSPLGSPRDCRAGSPVLASVLLCVASHFLAVAFARQCLFRTTLVSGLQIEGVLLDILDDIFLLHFPFETPKRTFDRLAVLEP
jgi:hypothetical protein